MHAVPPSLISSRIDFAPPHGGQYQPATSQLFAGLALSLNYLRTKQTAFPHILPALSSPSSLTPSPCPSLYSLQGSRIRFFFLPFLLVKINFVAPPHSSFLNKAPLSISLKRQISAVAGPN